MTESARAKYESLIAAKEREEKARPALVNFLRVVHEQDEQLQVTESVQGTQIILFSYR